MTLKRFIVFFMVFLDVAAFPYACFRKSNPHHAIIGTGSSDEAEIENVTYINQFGNEEYLSSIYNFTYLTLENGYVKLSDGFKTTLTIIDYEEVFNEKATEPKTHIYQITGWLLLDCNHKIDYDKPLQLPYKYSNDDFIDYYCGHRNVIVLHPIVTQIQ